MEAIFLSSDQCRKEFPGNQGGDFRNILNYGFSVASQQGRYIKVSLAELFYIPNSWSNIRAGQTYIDIKISNYPIATHTLQTIYANKYQVIEKGNLQFIKPSFQFKSSTSLEYRVVKAGRETHESEYGSIHAHWKIWLQT